MKNIVKMSDLTNEEVYELITRVLELKNGSKIQRVQNTALRLQSINIDLML